MFISTLFLLVLTLASAGTAQTSGLNAAGYDIYCGRSGAKIPKGVYHACFASNDGPVLQETQTAGNKGTGWYFPRDNSDRMFAVALDSTEAALTILTQHYEVWVTPNALVTNQACVHYSIAKRRNPDLPVQVKTWCPPDANVVIP